MGRTTITLDSSMYTILIVLCIYIYIYILPKGGAIFWGITLAFDDFAELLKIVDNLEL